jgi:hypothetical protein
VASLGIRLDLPAGLVELFGDIEIECLAEIGRRGPSQKPGQKQ